VRVIIVKCLAIVKGYLYAPAEFADLLVIGAIKSAVKEAVAKGVIPHHLAETRNAYQFVKAEAINLNLEVPVDCACCVIHNSLCFDFVCKYNTFI
jgi:hypothetical protein